MDYNGLYLYNGCYPGPELTNSADFGRRNWLFLKMLQKRLTQLIIKCSSTSSNKTDWFKNKLSIFRGHSL